MFRFSSVYSQHLLQGSGQCLKQFLCLKFTELPYDRNRVLGKLNRSEWAAELRHKAVMVTAQGVRTFQKFWGTISRQQQIPGYKKEIGWKRQWLWYKSMCSWDSSSFLYAPSSQHFCVCCLSCFWIGLLNWTDSCFFFVFFLIYHEFSLNLDSEPVPLAPFFQVLLPLLCFGTFSDESAFIHHDFVLSQRRLRNWLSPFHGGRFGCTPNFWTVCLSTPLGLQGSMAEQMGSFA